MDSTPEDILKQAPPKPSRKESISVEADPIESPLRSTEPHTISPIDDAFAVTPVERSDSIEAPSVPGSLSSPQGKKRYRFDVQFLGTKYYGWQSRTIKAALPTVQDAVEDAISAACDSDSVRVVASTLTETGIHCRNMTCHVDLDDSLEMPSQRVLLQRCEKWLEKRGDNVAVLSFMTANPGFHARFCAQRRTYVYRILNRIAPPLMDGKEMQWHVDRALNTAKMADAAAVLQGTHDFGGFADHSIARQLALKGESYSVRTLESIRVVRQADEVLLWFMGQSFLRHQIRNIVSCLHMVGLGIWSTDDVQFVLDREFVKGRSRERIRPPTAPASGLTLWEVGYDQSLYPRPHEFVQDL